MTEEAREVGRSGSGGAARESAVEGTAVVEEATEGEIGEAANDEVGEHAYARDGEYAETHELIEEGLSKGECLSHVPVAAPGRSQGLGGDAIVAGIGGD